MALRLSELMSRIESVYSEGLKSPIESWTSAANSLRLQMRGSDDVDCGQIPLIKITMAENAGTLACLC